MKPSIEETLIDWFGEKSLEIKNLEVTTDADMRLEEYDHPHLYLAIASFYKVGFDVEEDGPTIELLYHQMTLADERFVNTKLEFNSETEFKIV